MSVLLGVFVPPEGTLKSHQQAGVSNPTNPEPYMTTLLMEGYWFLVAAKMIDLNAADLNPLLVQPTFALIMSMLHPCTQLHNVVGILLACGIVLRPTTHT